MDTQWILGPAMGRSPVIDLVFFEGASVCQFTVFVVCRVGRYQKLGNLRKQYKLTLWRPLLP